MPVLYDGINEAVNNREKADLCVMAFQAMQSAVGSDSERGRGRQLLAEEKQKLRRNEDNAHPINVHFTIQEHRNAIHSVPGRIRLVYIYESFFA